MTCQTTGCTQPEDEVVVILGEPRYLCEPCALSAWLWIRLHEPDDEPLPRRRPCALPDCTRRRALGRAVCTTHAKIGDNA